MRNTSIQHLRRTGRKALTLIELLVVLVILTTVSVVVLEGTAGRIDEAAYDKTVSSLNAVRSAVIGNPLMTGDEPIVSYLADCGSLPKRPSAATPEFYLDGLVNIPTGMQAYALRTAPSPDTDLQLYTGWRGPYISLPLNTTELLDGWNNPYTFTLDGATSEVLSIQSAGGLEAPYNITIPAAPLTFDKSTLFVTITGAVNYDLSAANTISAKIFFPSSTDGNLSSQTTTSASVNGEGVWAFQFTNIPIGYHPIRIRVATPAKFETEWITVPQGGVSGVQLYIQN